jgi:hypothetical protein
MASSKRSVEKEELWRLALAEHAASDLSEGSSDFTNAHAVAVSQTNASVIVHAEQLGQASCGKSAE